MAKTAWIDLSSKTIEIQETPVEYLKQFIGEIGRAHV